MSTRSETSKEKIYNFFSIKSNTPQCDEERATKVQKLDPKGTSETTPNAQGVELQGVGATTSNLQRVKPYAIDATTLFERDLGLRLQIFEYHKDKWNDVRREYLKMGSYRWSLKAKDYLLAKSDRQNRRFIPEWFQAYAWLEYSPSQDTPIVCHVLSLKKIYQSKIYLVEGFKH